MGSFAELIDYDALFAEIEQRRALTTEQKQNIQAICTEEMKRRANPGIGNSLGSFFQGIVYRIFSFAQNLFKGFKGSDPIESIADAGKETGTKMDAHMRDQATTMARQRIADLYGSQLANEITGQYPVSQADEIPNAPPHNLVAQINQARNIPDGTSSRLNRGAV